MAGRVHQRGRLEARSVWVIALVIALAPWSEGFAQQGSGGEGGGASLKGRLAPCPAEGGMPSFKPLHEIEVDPRLNEPELPPDCSASLFGDEAGFEGGDRPGGLGWLCGLMASDRVCPSAALF